MSRALRQESATAETAAQPADFESWRRDHFIALRLALSLPFMALAPVFLLVRGAPSIWDAAAFGFLLVPLVGVYILHRWERFDLAQAICTGAILLFGIVLTLANGALTLGAVACFLLGPLEATLGGVSRIAYGGAAASIAAMLAMAFATAFGALQPVAGAGIVDFVTLMAAMIYGALLAVWSAHTGEMHDRCAQASAAAYRELTATVGDLVVKFDRGGAVVDLVTDPANAFRHARRDLMGRGLFERIQVADRPAFLKTVADAAFSDQVAQVEFRLRAEAAAEDEDAPVAPRFIWVEMRAHRSRAAEGIVMAILRDVTLMKEAREAMEEAREESERASAWKDRFLANVSHELRTPLNAIIGFSEMLANAAMAPKDPARARDYAAIIHQSGEHLLSLVNTILDMSKIETGNFEIEPEPFDLAGLIDFCCDVVRLKADEKGIDLSRACASPVGEIVADKRACKQILLNLLSNALKFTPDGGRVAIQARPDGAFVEIVVLDTGIGVNPADLARLGDPFFQARATYDRPYEGAGLGLSIVRGLVGLHGGSLVFESAPNEGACVTVRLPRDCRDRGDFAESPVKIETLARRSYLTAAPDLARSNDQVKKIA
ncbi:HAMP domain-containing histidine kinase [Rhodoblastus acidophilus]|uniref:histidine kinase n=1 Tax=Candidatus Rhodoblastus alkanivorans TaxID=2954117 RepID=A0ABS9Z873_9HYPH|nr:HAMP domain-containing sensor histidine kinase [Candidatus Rhodoblastus alkanivorans]MCI4677979.1 HAMP domain-containing histidine kinase [Candidatus Rhodoblastus alkanivorans]MCI4683874.1 HAMP domain-containing histidine kinase [Candidatus Rhodoblastus alkanivorans]